MSQEQLTMWWHNVGGIKASAACKKRKQMHVLVIGGP